MSVLNQNHNMFDDFTVLETVMMGNKVLYAIKKEMDELYADYDDKNADITILHHQWSCLLQTEHNCPSSYKQSISNYQI